MSGQPEPIRLDVTDWDNDAGYAPDAAERIALLPDFDMTVSLLPLSDAEVLARTDVTALMQGFARSRSGRCPYGSPSGCRCAHCYQDGSGQ